MPNRSALLNREAADGQLFVFDFVFAFDALTPLGVDEPCHAFF